MSVHLAPGEWIGTVLLMLATSGSFAQPSGTVVDTSGWKTYRDERMGFEARYPSAWQVGSIRSTGSESVMLGETPQAGKSRLAVQFWVQRSANPRGLPMSEWYASGLHKIGARPQPAASVQVGGRAALRIETIGTFGRSFHFFASTNGTDVFEITLLQPASEAQLDPVYGAILSSVSFVP